MKKLSLSVFLIILFLCLVVPISSSASPVITKPVSYGEYKPLTIGTISWTCSDANVDHYLLSIRYFTKAERNNDNNGTDDGAATSSSGTMVLERENIGNVTSYSILIPLFSHNRLYKVAVCAVKTNGSRSWSTPRYFYIGCHSRITSPPISFKIWTGFTSLTKEQIYYSSHTWYNALGQEYINTYPFNQGTNNNVFNNNDGISCITKVALSDEDYPYALVVTAHNTSNPTEIDICFNSTYSSYFANSAQPGKYDVQSLVTHEMGHAIGLTDKYEFNWSSSWTMHGFASVNDISRRSLESADIIEAKTLYGIPLN